jgi:hypothetical protein
MIMNGKLNKIFYILGQLNSDFLFLHFTFVFSLLKTQYLRPTVLHEIGFIRVALTFVRYQLHIFVLKCSQVKTWYWLITGD